MGSPGVSGLIPHSSWPSLSVWADDNGTSITKIELLPSQSTMALIEETTEVEDPWDVPELKHKGIKWSGKNEASLGRQEGTARWPEGWPSSLQYHLPSHCSGAL